MNVFTTEPHLNATSLLPVTKDILQTWLKDEGKIHQTWVEANQFKAAAGSMLMIPHHAPGEEAKFFILAGIDEASAIWSWGALVTKLPAGTYRLPADMETEEIDAALLGWALGSYQFDRYKSQKEQGLPILEIPQEYNSKEILAQAEGIYLCRDLINTPAEDMGPAHLQQEMEKLAAKFGGSIESFIGDTLLERNFPMIHAVGRAAAPGREPRLIKLNWGNSDDPQIALVGKGVCFDTGGLDLKGSNYMLTMKKDMGGAANILGLAYMIMSMGLKVNLNVYIPAVENNVSANSYRPMDILTARNGTTVEIGNTDAEGRLVLADALTYAGEDYPQEIIEMATLTGAARVALGTDLPALFSNSDKMANNILTHAKDQDDPLWRLPLHQPYRKMLDNKNADMSNVSSGGYAGAITAALFLEHFITEGINWTHIDLMAYNLSTKAGKPEGGEAQGVRAVYAYLKENYL